MIPSLKDRPTLDQHPKLQAAYQKAQLLIDALNAKDIPLETEMSIREEIQKIDAYTGPEKGLAKVLRKGQRTILAIVRKETGLVSKGFYRTLWMSLGMTVFGLPLGMAYAIAMNNFGLFAIGLPIGMGIGIAVGSGMDSKAAKDGKQLEWG
ncbi:MAG: hypothetical protein AAF587_10720 [Bacteroidota bacterium]